MKRDVRHRLIVAILLAMPPAMLALKTTLPGAARADPPNMPSAACSVVSCTVYLPILIDLNPTASAGKTIGIEILASDGLHTTSLRLDPFNPRGPSN